MKKIKVINYLLINKCYIDTNKLVLFELNN